MRALIIGTENAERFAITGDIDGIAGSEDNLFLGDDDFCGAVAQGFGDFGLAVSLDGKPGGFGYVDLQFKRGLCSGVVRFRSRCRSGG